MDYTTGVPDIPELPIGATQKHMVDTINMHTKAIKTSWPVKGTGVLLAQMPGEMGTKISAEQQEVRVEAPPAEETGTRFQ